MGRVTLTVRLARPWFHPAAKALKLRNRPPRRPAKGLEPLFTKFGGRVPRTLPPFIRFRG
jgi:hypothetical protein